MTKVFISYHHENDQVYREHLSLLAAQHGVFEDGSVMVDDINENLGSQQIRRSIRDEYLKDTKVTILLCGTETKFRKHVDWELKSSMIDGTKNRQSGILVINLPTISCDTFYPSLPGEIEQIYPDYTGEWFSPKTKPTLNLYFLICLSGSSTTCWSQTSRCLSCLGRRSRINLAIWNFWSMLQHAWP